MCYCGEQPKIYKESMRIARKAHKCCECRREIQPGDRYQYVSGLWEDRFSHFKTCDTCLDLKYRIYFEVDCPCLAFTELLSGAQEYEYLSLI